MINVCFILMMIPIILFSKVFEIDSTHSYVGFKVKYMMLSNVRGNFSDFSGRLEMVGDEITKIKGQVQVDSISTNNKKRDKHLKSPDFFNAETYPEMRFNSKKVVKNGDQLSMVGQLTIHGISKDVVFPFEKTPVYIGNKGTARFGVEAQLKINRKDYGILYSKKMDNGGLVVDDYVTIILNIQFIEEVDNVDS
ncbi:MAG: YceI family protein [Candidatus Margulisiibacteriota bacterium]